MPTFSELQHSHSQASFKKAVLTYLIEHIDENFRSVAGGDPKSYLKTDDGRAIPQEAFENVITEILLVGLSEQDRVLDELLRSNLQPVQMEEELLNGIGSDDTGAEASGTDSTGGPEDVGVPTTGGTPPSGPGNRRPGRRASN